MTRLFIFGLVLGMTTVSVACSSSDRGEPARVDSGGVMLMDSGTVRRDSGTPTRDSGIVLMDSGMMMPRDTGMMMRRDTGGMVTPPDGRVGSSCMGDMDCTEPPMAMCVTDFMGFALPGGYCSAMCMTDADCGTGAGCAMPFGDGFCLRECSGPSDCRTSEGYMCGMIPIGGDPRMFCLPPFM